MKADDIQVKILLNLLEYEELGYNQLYNKVAVQPKGPIETTVARGTFRKRLYALRDDWNPPLVVCESPKKRGKKGRYYLTKAGERKAEIEKMLLAVHIETENFLKTFLDEAIEHGKRRPLVGVSTIVTSKHLPIFGIMHLSSTKEYQTLVKKLNREEPRKEIGPLIGKLIDFYSGEAGQFYADYLPQKGAVFFIGEFPSEISSKMKEAVEKLGVFRNYTHILKQVLVSAEQWFSTLLEEFKQGKELTFNNGKKFRYDLEKQKVVKVS